MVYNTLSRKQRITEQEYRGSYTMHLTVNQFKTLTNLANELDIDLEDIWCEFFSQDIEYKIGNWREISINAASEIIAFLLRIRKAEQLEKSFLAKIQRTEQEQHEWEMYPDGKL